MIRVPNVFAFLAALAVAAPAAEGERTFSLKTSPRPGVALWLVVEVGALTPGQRVRFETPSGQLVGVISPFGPAQHRSGGVYALPVPPDAMRDGRLTVVITVTKASGPPRAPTAAEVRDVQLRENPAPR